jgi:hypothetical protein
MATLGYTAKDGTSFGSAEHYALYARYVTDASGGDVSTIHAYVKNTAGVAAYFRMAIYTDDAANNLPETIVGAEVRMSQAASTGPSEISAAYAATLAANTAYWIAIVAETGAIETYNTTTGAGDSGYYNIGADTLPSPFSHSATSERNWEYNIWATYAAAGGGVNTKIVSYYMARRRN